MGGTGQGETSPRDAVFDLVRAAALVRVVAFHLLGWAWLQLIPAVPLMFVVAGALARRSCEGGGAGHFLRSRFRAVWLPAALYGVVVVAAVVASGSLHRVGIARAVAIALPGANPLGPAAGRAGSALDGTWRHLWFVDAYVWCVVATPIVLAWWRRRRAVLWCALAAVAVGAQIAVSVGAAARTEPPSRLRDAAALAVLWVAGFEYRPVRSVPTLARSFQPASRWLVDRGLLIYLWHPVAAAVVGAALQVTGVAIGQPVRAGLALAVLTALVPTASAASRWVSAGLDRGSSAIRPSR